MSEAERLHDAMCSWISAKFPRSHTVHVIEEALEAARKRGYQQAKDDILNNMQLGKPEEP